MSEHTEQHLGRPIQKLGGEENLENTMELNIELHQANESQDSGDELSSGRGGDDMLGRPKQKPAQAVASEVTVKQIQAHEKIHQKQREQKQYEQSLSDQPLKNNFGWARGVWMFSWVLGGLIGWFILSEFLSILKLLEGRPLWIQVLTGIVMLFFTALVAYPLWRLRQRYRELTQVKQVDMVSVQRQSSETGAAMAREELLDYSRKFASLSPAHQNRLQNIGLDVQVLKDSAQHLLNKEKQLDSSTWLNEFELRLLQHLDQAGSERIEYHAKMVAVKSAISPNGLLDMAMVLYNGFSLLDDLCLIYQVRASRSGMVYLMGLVIAQSYLAGEMEDGFTDMAQDVLPEGLLGSLGGFLGSAAAQAGAHYLFMRRIGGAMQKRLRPLHI